ncbi:MAG TPA: DUF4112 domain-containing protein [Humisphaera sp.]
MPFDARDDSAARPAAVRVEVRPTDRPPADAVTGFNAAELERDVRRVRAFAKLMDSRFEVGGMKLGLDSLIGLIPVIGDTVASLLAFYPLAVARKHGLGKVVQWRMMANITADWAVGLIPVVGDVADVGFKANLMNATLLEKAAAKKLGRPVATGEIVEGDVTR